MLFKIHMFNISEFVVVLLHCCTFKQSTRIVANSKVKVKCVFKLFKHDEKHGENSGAQTSFLSCFQPRYLKMSKNKKYFLDK